MEQNKTDKTEKNIVYVRPEIAEIIPVYIERRKKDIIVMENALLKNDLETIRKISHKIKGTGSLYSLDEISHIGRELEAGAKNNNYEDMKKYICELSDFVSNLEIKISNNGNNSK
ncbi:MAG: Hpt domain-containing protein [Elusimicrobia bacterium]|nr:Hpt domain-containing protein [Elusimicrobiota bacterium]